jgi:hypothetical protein
VMPVAAICLDKIEQMAYYAMHSRVVEPVEVAMSARAKRVGLSPT